MIRPTRRGLGAFLLAFVLTDLGALGGNNLVVLVASVAWAALLVDAVLGRASLRSLSVVRELPAELFARTGCRGRFQVTNHGRLAARQLTLDDGVASATAAVVPEGDVGVAAWWRMPTRGPATLGAIRVETRFPFGLFVHRRLLGEPVDVLVFPTPRPGRTTPARRSARDGATHPLHQGAGDLRNLRPYQPGDRLRSLHWATSARVGRPMVALRHAEVDAGVVVTLPAPPDEDSLEEATGAVLDACAQGVPVGLTGLDPRLARPRTGIRWRRRLLDAMALAEAAP